MVIQQVKNAQTGQVDRHDHRQ